MTTVGRLTCGQQSGQEKYYNRLREMNVEVHAVVGNHTAYFKDTNSINTLDNLLGEYENVHTYSEATEVTIGGLPILLFPGSTMKILRPLINLLKIQIATTRWGTLSSTDLKLIVDTSWSTVLRANAI